MQYQEDDYLQLSGVQHFIFCRRQWALIHIEMQWAENFRTADGRILHENAHDGSIREKRGNVVITRAMRVASPRLGISGECDVVEFHKDADGIAVQGMDGTFRVIPVEYKRGKTKVNDCDRIQLCAQALCLEDMLCCDIPSGFLYYGETKRREAVDFTPQLREETEKAIAEMHMLYERHHTPKSKRTKSCNACSLKEICLPVICGKKTASDYLVERLKEDAL